jgi:hypothetical protein
MRFPAYMVLALAFLTAACGGSDTATSPSTPTDTTPLSATERFDAVLDPGTSAFFSFVVSANGAVAINLASLSPLDRPGLLPVLMQIGYGTPAGEGCTIQKSMQTVPGLTSQLTDTLVAGTYCASLVDVGNLKQSANFTMRITHP